MTQTTKNPLVENKTDSSIITFTTAFALGALLSYFVTPAGKKTWQKLAIEWEKAKKELFAQGLIPSQEMSLDDFKMNYLRDLQNSFQQLKSNSEIFLQKAEKLLQEKKTAKKQQKKFKFKGVK